MISKSEYSTVLTCANVYKEELLDTNIIFIYENRITKQIEYVESTFLAGNFKHLTGIIYPNESIKSESDDKIGQAIHFFNLALSKRLNIDKCKYKRDGTTALKLQILSSIMNIKRTARMIGDYNQSRLHIMADKMCGSVSATLAFTQDKEYGLCPSSTIKDDIRNLVNQYHPIVAVYQKPIDEEKYSQCHYISKKYDASKLPDIIKNKLK